MTTTATTNQLTAAGAGSISTIVDDCLNQINQNNYEACKVKIISDLKTHVQKLIDMLDKVRGTEARKKMYLLRSFINSVVTFADRVAENCSSIVEHLTNIRLYGKEAEDLLTQA